MIEMGKNYRTRDGRAVTLLTTDGGGKYPVLGFIDGKTGAYGGKAVNRWTSKGWWLADDPEERTDDLVEAKPETKSFANVYDDGCGSRHRSLQDTATYRAANRKFLGVVATTIIDGRYVRVEFLPKEEVSEF